MGRSNQQRRAAKRRRQERGPGGPRRAGATSVFSLETSLVQGARAAHARDADEVEWIVAGLVERAAAGGAVTVAAGAVCEEVLAALWDGGWQPVEVARQVGRRRRDRHVALVTAAMASAGSWRAAGGAAMPPAWVAQLDRLGVPTVRDQGGDWLGRWLRSAGGSLADGLRLTLETLGELVALGVIEALLPPPAAWRHGAAAGAAGAPDDPVLAKVRALLAKAESTQFAAEAEALAAKAQELMARHAIEEAVARSTTTREERPIIRRLAVDDPYAEAKSTLLGVVARANAARCVWYEPYALMAVVGFARDLDAIEALFTSLLVQASRAMLEKGSVTDGAGRSRTRSFRQSFLLAYAVRIGQRLEEAASQARRHAASELAVDLTPVLASRDQEIREALEAAFPSLRRSHGPAITNQAGWHAGRVAAEMATLGPQRGALDTAAAG